MNYFTLMLNSYSTWYSFIR